MIIRDTALTALSIHLDLDYFSIWVFEAWENFDSAISCQGA